MSPPGKSIDARLRFVSDGQLYHLEFAALGTDCRALFAPASRQVAESFARALVQWVADFESRYSRFRDNSLVSHINRSSGKAAVPLDRDARRIFGICEDVYQATEGLLDVTTLPIQLLWDRCRDRGELPAEAEIAATRALVGWPMVELGRSQIYLPKAGMQIDLGGWGKEYAVDRAAEIADAHRIRCYLIDFGRDIRCHGTPPGKPSWKIGLEDPLQPGHALYHLYLTEGSVATSGNYRRSFLHRGAVFGHIVDPRSGRPAGQAALSATVTAPTCLQAGILSTTACILGREAGLGAIESACGAEGCLVHQSRTFASKRFFVQAENPAISA